MVVILLHCAQLNALDGYCCARGAIFSIYIYSWLLIDNIDDNKYCQRCRRVGCEPAVQTRSVAVDVAPGKGGRSRSAEYGFSITAPLPLHTEIAACPAHRAQPLAHKAREIGGSCDGRIPSQNAGQTVDLAVLHALKILDCAWGRETRYNSVRSIRWHCSICCDANRGLTEVRGAGY